MQQDERPENENVCEWDRRQDGQFAVTGEQKRAGGASGKGAAQPTQTPQQWIAQAHNDQAHAAAGQEDCTEKENESNRHGI